MRFLPLLCLAVAGCNFNEDYVRARMATASDHELQRGAVIAAFPSHRRYAQEELEKRGLARPGSTFEPKP
jgi:hypothetical protein